MNFIERVNYTTDLLTLACKGHERSFSTIASLMQSSTLFAQIVCLKHETRIQFAEVIKQWAIMGRNNISTVERTCILDTIMKALNGLLRQNEKIHFVQAVNTLMTVDSLSEVARLLISDINITDATYAASSQLLVLYSIHTPPMFKTTLMRIGLIDTCARIHKLARMPLEDPDYLILAKFINDNILYLLNHAQTVLIMDNYKDSVSAMEVVCEFLVSISTGQAADVHDNKKNKSQVFFETVYRRMFEFVCTVSGIITARLDDLKAQGVINLTIINKIVACLVAIHPIARRMLGASRKKQFKIVTSEVCKWVASVEPLVKVYIDTIMTLVRMDAYGHDDNEDGVMSTDPMTTLLSAHDMHRGGSDGLMTAYCAQKKKNESLKQALRVVQDETTKLQCDIDKSEDQIRDLRERSAVLDKEYDMALQTATLADQRNTKLLATCARLQDANSALAQQRRELSVNVNDLQCEIDDLSRARNDKMKTLQMLHKEMEALDLSFTNVRTRMQSIVLSHRMHTEKARAELYKASLRTTL